MGYVFDQEGIEEVFTSLGNEYDVYGPVVFKDGSIHSDKDMIRYVNIESVKDIVFHQKSAFSFKEILLPIMQTLFYFTEEKIQSTAEPKKGAIVLLRHCDLHAVKSLDDMYLHNGEVDHYYQRIREHIKFVVIGCQKSFENCFCVSMKTNKSYDYHFSLDQRGNEYFIDCQDQVFNNLLQKYAKTKQDVDVNYVTDNNVKVHIPGDLKSRVAFSKMWDEYDVRCIACGRCNFVCPSCTCHTMQDIFYEENGRTGERKRVWASCMVDGYTNVAGGHACRQKHGTRMRFKVLHKVLDHNKRFGHMMCVGCGRCDDVCPEYISFSHAVNKLEDAMVEVDENE